MKRHVAVPLVLGVLIAGASPAWPAATVTFTADGTGTFPRTLERQRGTSVIKIDVSKLPPDATIFRAELVLKLPDRGGQRPLEPTAVHPVGRPDRRLAFVPPRNVGLDCLDVVREAVGKGVAVRLAVAATAAGVRRLEVSYLEGKPKRTGLPVARNVQATHRSGQTFITFAEPKLEPWPRFENGAAVAAFKRKYAPPGMRFRIWRSARPITARSIAEADLVGECGFFTAWNDGYHQGDTKELPPLRYRVTDDGPPVEWGTGIYAHNPPAAGKAYYAVTVAVDGEEDFDRLGRANTTAAPLHETVGPGEPVLQWVDTPDPQKGWHFRRGRIARLVYTRWESPPRASTPSVPIDYLVAIPLEARPDGASREARYRAWRTEPAPVGLHLHCWGGSCNGGYGWWYNAHRGSVLIASNQVPYDWWTGYHEAIGTAMTWGDGCVRPFTMNRLLDFLDWAARQHASAPGAVRAYWPRLDLTRVFAAGNSMGGAGAPMLAIRHGDRVAWAISWVGVHVPELSPQFAGSYRNSYGPRHDSIHMPDGRTSPWDHFSDVWWLREHVAADTGLIIASNGKNDGAIGWRQAVLFAEALQETRRPHIFNWAKGGHGTRTLIGSNFDLDVRTDQTLPAFTSCSLDDDLGDGAPDSGDDVGQLNAHLRWNTREVIDEPDRWEMTVLLKDDAPRETCTCDVTPRRCQRFKVRPGDVFRWTNTPADGTAVAGGRVTADRWGLVTVERVEVSKAGNRIRITRE